MNAIFLRALEETEDKDRVLREAIASPEAAKGNTRFDVRPADFSVVPGSPWAYWASTVARALFATCEPLESEGRVARRGVNSNDDFRFLRLAWEVQGFPWRVHVKGGAYATYYSDPYMRLNWGQNGEELSAERVTTRAYKSAIIPSRELYFRRGLTWSRRTKTDLSVRAMPADCVFGDKGPAIVVNGDDALELSAVLAITNSAVFRALVELQLAAADARRGGAARSYEVGILQRTPLPALSNALRVRLASSANAIWSLERDLDSSAEDSSIFELPAMLKVKGESLAFRHEKWAKWVTCVQARIAEIQSDVERWVLDAYGIQESGLAQISRGLVANSDQRELPEPDNSEDDAAESKEAAAATLLVSLLSWMVGVAFGRFDLRHATDAGPEPSESGPFDPLPVCSRGMLTGEDGLPLSAPPDGYAIDFPRDGILVDDAGAPWDLVAAARRVFEHIFDDPAARWEEAADILDKRDRTLRGWFARDFFELHLKQYSKSRRKAPIYWPLSTASGSYTVWVYYHRLTADTLFQMVVKHLDPKIREVQEERLQIDGRLGRAEGREAAKLTKQAGELAELEQELEEMKAELLRVAELPYKPDLNDGVQITAAPLWKLFRAKAWSKVLESTWKKLEKGEYDWAHLAYAIWPDRVREKCKTDRSLAIAHGLEGAFEGGNGRPAAKRASRRRA